MSATNNSAMIHARIDPELKKAVEVILKQLGLSSAEAIRMYYAQIANKKAIPFSLNLEKEDHKKHYTKVKSQKHLKSLIGID